MSVSTSEMGQNERRVLIPVDHSANSRRAVYWYLENLSRKNDLVIFVHVIDQVDSSNLASSSYEEFPKTFNSLRQLSETTNSKGKTFYHNFLHMVDQEKLNSRNIIFADQKPAKAILRAVAEIKPHMIVMGNRGVGKLHETFLGSVSANVLHHAAVPVCIVPPIKHANIWWK
ncbi:hypothetical protein FBUS_01679 [Fasciolopsis buskii]|uniref:UspA domain-containing protein n=1 Tax=Fasciolopsis buskii TaxID=27845 RepID=A0A8E0VP56_9TREM|nr:hypothetical protein FBUS_01679 [Fasciolopsis buski]